MKMMNIIVKNINNPNSRYNDSDDALTSKNIRNSDKNDIIINNKYESCITVASFPNISGLTYRRIKYPLPDISELDSTDINTNM
jgi:hypothetical protein